MIHFFNSLKFMLRCHPLNENYSDSYVHYNLSLLKSQHSLFCATCFHSSYHFLIDYKITCF